MRTEYTAADVLQLLESQHKTLCTAESCTGGLLGKLLTDVPGSSRVYLGGIISYTNTVKMRLLHVSAQTLEAHTAVSAQTAGEMARGARRQLGADVAVSVTGLAGPDGDGTGRPVGLVYIALDADDGCIVQQLHLSGDRAAIRMQAAQAVFALIHDTLGDTDERSE